MTENDGTVDPAVTDIDDVEAHGVKEVVAGLSAAAVLTGGAAAVMSNQGDGGSSGSTIHATDAIGADTTAGGVEASTSLGRSGATSPTSVTASSGGTSLKGGSDATSATQDVRTDDAAADAVSPNRTVMGRADARVDGTVEKARAVRDNVVEWADDTTEATRATVKGEVREAGAAVREAPNTARTAVQNLRSGTVSTSSVREVAQSADAKIDATLVLAGDVVRGVVGSTQTTIARVQPGVGAEVNAENASGWVTVTVGGEEVARSEVKDGQASVSWAAPSPDAIVQFHYSGNDILNATSVTL